MLLPVVGFFPKDFMFSFEVLLVEFVNECFVHRVVLRVKVADDSNGHVYNPMDDAREVFYVEFDDRPDNVKL